MQRTQEEKIELWKQMARFLQKDLEFAKEKAAETAIAFEKQKGEFLKKIEDDAASTETSIQTLTAQIEDVKGKATANAQTATT